MQRKTMTFALVLLSSVAAVGALAHARGGGHGGGWQDGGGYGHHRGGGRHGMGRVLRLDADKDGSVTLDEFLIRRTDRFKALDKNGDGSLDAAELVQPMLEKSDYRGRAMLKRFDTDGDGKVTKGEIEERARRRFAERDLNSDGVIGGDDLPPGKRNRWRDRSEKDDDTASDAAGADKTEATTGEQRASASETEGRKMGGEGRRRGWRHGREHSLDDAVRRADRRFSRLDRDNDGDLDATDLDAMSAEQVAYAKRKRMHVLDADRNGKVSLDEFLNRPKQRFADMDLDDDGRITSADLPPGMAERWEKRRERR